MAIRARVLQTSAILFSAALLAGCGQAVQHEGAASAGQPRAAVAPVSEPRAAQPGPQPEPRAGRCHTSMLSGSMGRVEPGAGQRYAELTLTNSSNETCDIYGYGGLRLVDEAGNPLPTNLTRSPNPGPTLIELSPGESASATLHWTAVPHEGEPTDGPCQPTPATAQITPPDETDWLPVDWTGGPVCGRGDIEGSAYHQ
ncbi:DUF4232 domain-containing protein [Saccharopolyspora halophila]|uniref:DUF4232 domain-containing protein n=1 Tax=Saccharopolyspora halophila TaxID=405551 RepID=A0ABN3FUI5_9PSEU